MFSDSDLEVLRLIVNAYLSKDKDTFERFCDQFGLVVLTADSFDDATMNMTSALLHQKRPYIFLVNEFWVFVYTAKNIEECRKRPHTYFHIPPFVDELNYPSKTPIIVSLPKNSWTGILKKWVRDIAPLYVSRLNQKIANAGAVLKQAKKFGKKRGVRRVSKHKKRR